MLLHSLLHLSNVGLNIGGTEDSRSRNKDIRALGCAKLGILHRNTTVDFDVNGGRQCANFRNLLQAILHKLLSSESGLNSHHEDHVPNNKAIHRHQQKRNQISNSRNGSFRLNGNRTQHTSLTDALNNVLRIL